jgi:uncharacterized membrane protein
MNEAPDQERLEDAIARWRSAGIITGDQANKIVAFELERGEEIALSSGGAKPDRRASLQLGSIISYIGGFLILFALTIFIGLAWDAMSRGTQFFWALVAVGGLCGAGFLLRRFESARLGGNLLVFAGAGALPLLVYTFQRLVGWWPGDSQLEYEDFHDRILAVWIVMELISMAGAIALAWLIRFPLMMLLAGFWGWYLSMDLARWVRGDDHDFWSDDHHWVGFVVGLLIVGAGLELARRHLRSYAFWLLLFGNLAWLAHLGDLALDDGFGAASVLFLLVSLAAIVLSVVTQFRVFLVFGALGLYAWVCYLVFDTFDDSSSVTLGLVLVGVFIVLTGIGYQKWLEPTLERWLRDVRMRKGHAIEPS